MLPSDNLIPFADRLAENLCSEEGLKTFKLTVQALRAASNKKADAGRDHDSTRPIRVGIWERESNNMEAPFIRIKTGDEWRFWADAAEIPGLSGKRRVLLLGESAARGFFYDPYVNPAAFLQAMLQESSERDDIEVIDLARIDLPLFPIQQLTQSALALKPDAIVIFAGNNWQPGALFNTENLGEVAALVRTEAAGKKLKAYMEQLLREQVQSFLATLERISQDHRVPIVFVIPEFNLVDWRSDAGAPVMFHDPQLAAWLETRERAEQALASGKNREAEHLAQELLSLDGGTTPAGFTILFKSIREHATNQELRSILESARDAGIALPIRQTPRCFGTVQKILRDNGPKRGLVIIDLPQRFEEYLEGDLPDRRIFHDYCHLTLEGMKVAMASVADVLLPILGKPQRTWRRIADTNLSVPNKVKAEAHFLAAIHNANFGNAEEVVRFHLKKALQEDPQIHKAMRLYLDFHLRRTPSPLCSTFEQLMSSDRLSIRDLLLRFSLTEKVINFEFVAALMDTLGSFGSGINDQIQSLAVVEHKITETKRNLLEKAYCGAPRELSWAEAECGYFRSATRKSRFNFICEKTGDVEIAATVRTGRDDAGTIMFNVNGVTLHELAASNKWRSTTFLVSHEHLEELNELEVIWPAESWASPHRLKKITDALEAGRIPEARPIYGEIHNLIACCRGLSERRAV